MQLYYPCPLPLSVWQSEIAIDNRDGIRPNQLNPIVLLWQSRWNRRFDRIIGNTNISFIYISFVPLVSLIRTFIVRTSIKTSTVTSIRTSGRTSTAKTSTKTSTVIFVRTSGRTSIRISIDNLRVLNTSSSSGCCILIYASSSVLLVMSAVISAAMSVVMSVAASARTFVNFTSYFNCCTTSCPNHYTASYSNRCPCYPITATATAVATT